MYDASPIGLAILDTDLRYLRINDCLAQLNGVPAADHIGKSVKEIVPELSEQALAAFRRVLDGELLKGIELVGPTIARPDEACVWRQNWVPLRRADGEIIGVAVSCEDVSEERRAQRAVETLNRVNTALAGEHDLERLVQMMTDAGVELTSASVGAYFHNEMDESGERLHLFTLSGADRDDFIGLGRPRGTSILGPLFRNEVIRSADITKDPRYGMNAPYAGMPEGHPTVVSYLAVPVVTRAGEVLGGLLFGHHKPGCFSEHHEKLIQGLAAQAAVAIENARLLAAVQAANETLEHRVAERTAERDRVWRLSRDLLVVVGADGIFRSVSPAWATIFGHEAEEVIGRSVNDFLHPDDAELTSAAIASAAAGEAVPIVENRYYAKDGSVRWISWLTKADGALIYGSGRDVTESKAKDEALRETEAALRQAQKMEAMGQLTGGVAHDFNNLLTPIMGSLDLLRRRAGDDERTKRLLDGALQSAERARTLVQRLLAFARRQPLQPSPVDVVALVRDMAALLSSTLGPQIKLTIATEEGLSAAVADRNQLEMALLNLAVNAGDAMPSGGTLRIAVTPKHLEASTPDLFAGNYICLSVSDSGIGMDATTLARAIEPFFSTKGIGRGTGLGLSMVHGLARQLGGHLMLESACGQGTTAQLWLPACSAPSIALPLVTIEPRASASGMVLLVDDEDLVRGATAQMLQDLGYQVVEANSGEGALQMVRDGLRPDYLVSDHLMPGMTGTELARAVRTIAPEVGVLIVSGYADVEALSPDLAHLSKPFRQADLADALAGEKVFQGIVVGLVVQDDQR
jgi:PAS domain S-box-containing protein